MKQGLKNEKIKTYTVISVVTFVIIIILIGIYPSIYDRLCKNRIYDDLSDNMKQIMSANIRIIDVETHDDIKAYGSGASGVIIENKDQRYYALTAAHVVEDESRGYIACTVNTPTYKEYRKKSGNSGYISNDEYYSMMSEIKVEYISDESDLAVASFECDENLIKVEVASDVPENGDRIVCIGNSVDSEERFVESYGKIKSNLVEFIADKKTDTVLKHSAYIAPGSSGGAVYNENMKIAGINVGGGTDSFGRFKYGVMIPAEQIAEFIEEWHRIN